MAFLGTDVSEEHIAFIFTVARNCRVLTRATQSHFLEDGSLHSRPS
jgi:hypothetical protein